MLSLKTKYALYGAALALLLALTVTATLLLELRAHDAPLEEINLSSWVIVRGGLLVALSAALAFVYGGRLARSIDRLNYSAARIGAGDYSQPVSVNDQGEFGDLQRTLEQMRRRLAQTTVTRDYLQNVLDSMSDAVFVTAEDGLVRIANNAASRLTGVSDADLVGYALASLLDTGGQLSAEAALRRACEIGEGVLRTVSGQTIPVSFVGSVITSNDRQFAGHIYVARDITDRKRIPPTRLPFLPLLAPLTFRPGERATISKRDARHYCHCLGAKHVWRKFQGLPPIRKKGKRDRHVRFCTWPMGSRLSACLAQGVTNAAARQAGLPASRRCLLGIRAPIAPPVWGSIIDDLWIIHGEQDPISEEDAEQWADRMVAEWAVMGVPHHPKKVVDRQPGAEVQGAWVDFKKPGLRLADEKEALLLRSTQDF